MLKLTETREQSTVKLDPDTDLLAFARNKPKLIDSIDFQTRSFNTCYYIGVQWLNDSNEALHVKPKLNHYGRSTDFFQMLDFCLRHPDVYLHTRDLFGIDFDARRIPIAASADMLTPLIVAQFLALVRNIVKGGLRKGYYRVESNRRQHIKGKILIAKTLRQNHFKNKPLYTYCGFEEYGLNTLENKMLKGTLRFVSRYATVTKQSVDFNPTLNYILPAFENVEEEIGVLNGANPVNPFFRDYSEAIRLAQMIQRRFGYDVSSITGGLSEELPPFWIDMSKLFELYVLGRLRDATEINDVVFQAGGNYGQLDFLRTTPGREAIIDAKYKFAYEAAADGYSRYVIEDIRQLSGYARDEGVLQRFGNWNWLADRGLVKCLIIYPDDNAPETISEGDMFLTQISEFRNFYKLGIRLPSILPTP